MQLSSSLLENAVQAFATLPGVGKKSALRMALHLLKQSNEDVQLFANSIATMKNEIQFCRKCNNISDDTLCTICKNKLRQQQTICVVESIKDVITIESTQQYNGAYHVLGGVISPLDGVGPDQLFIDGLVSRVQNDAIEEIIFALNPNIQGDTTIYYIQKKLQNYNCKITTIARGIAFGGELEYADEMTLAKSLANRLPINTYVQ
ncbi:MAG: recombination mediator RecR [Chitinophagaceae bacterium]|jgi:recombination protein RecR